MNPRKSARKGNRSRKISLKKPHLQQLRTSLVKLQRPRIRLINRANVYKEKWRRKSMIMSNRKKRPRKNNLMQVLKMLRLLRMDPQISVKI